MDGGFWKKKTVREFSKKPCMVEIPISCYWESIFFVGNVSNFPTDSRIEQFRVCLGKMQMLSTLNPFWISRMMIFLTM